MEEENQPPEVILHPLLTPPPPPQYWDYRCIPTWDSVLGILFGGFCFFWGGFCCCFCFLFGGQDFAFKCTLAFNYVMQAGSAFQMLGLQMCANILGSRQGCLSKNQGQATAQLNWERCCQVWRPKFNSWDPHRERTDSGNAETNSHMYHDTLTPTYTHAHTK